MCGLSLLSTTEWFWLEGQWESLWMFLVILFLEHTQHALWGIGRKDWSSSKNWFGVPLIWVSHLEDGQLRPFWTLSSIFWNSNQIPGNYQVTWKLLSLSRSPLKNEEGSGWSVYSTTYATDLEWVFLHEKMCLWDFLEQILSLYVEAIWKCHDLLQMVKNNRWLIIFWSKEEADMTDN